MTETLIYVECMINLMICMHLDKIAYAADNILDELVGYFTRFTREEPEVVVVAADLAQHDERLA